MRGLVTRRPWFSVYVDVSFLLVRKLVFVVMMSLMSLICFVYAEFLVVFPQAQESRCFTYEAIVA